MQKIKTRTSLVVVVQVREADGVLLVAAFSDRGTIAVALSSTFTGVFSVASSTIFSTMATR